MTAELGDNDEGFVHFDAVRDSPKRTMRHWRESYFFVAHPQEGGDVLALTFITRPARASIEAYLMARVDGQLSFTRWSRPFSEPVESTVAGVSIDIVEPYQRIRLRAEDPAAPVEVDLEWTARTAPHGFPAGRFSDESGPVWDQRHMIQSGWFDGSYTVGGERRAVSRWWGQRDHSWGVRDHRRAPLWLWLAIQLPDGMLGVWCWERADGVRIYTEGCWAPAEQGNPVVAVVSFQHDLSWRGADHAEEADGLAGQVEFGLADGRTVRVTGAGRWSARYGRLGGGQQLMTVHTDDGRTGTAVYEITGSRHHHFFPG